MIFKNSIKQAAWAAVVVLFLAGPALAWGRGEGERPWQKNRPDRIKRMAEQLSLTEEQQAQMQAQRSQHREQQQALRQQIRDKRQELFNEFEKAEIDMARIQAIGADLKKLAGQEIDSRIEGILAVKKILTPEQFAEFQKKVREFGPGHGKHRGDKKGGRRGFWKMRQGGEEDNPEMETPEPMPPEEQ